ncbi:MAG: DUF3185 family protein [Phycisphaerales bacterium]
MRTAIGLALIVVGVILLVMGFNASDSLASDFSRFFTGNPTDRSIWLLVGGAAAVVVGVVVAALPARALART